MTVSEGGCNDPTLSCRLGMCASCGCIAQGLTQHAAQEVPYWLHTHVRTSLSVPAARSDAVISCFEGCDTALHHSSSPCNP